MGPKKSNQNIDNQQKIKPYDLDIDFYRETYKDLHNKTDEQLVKHYIRCGKKEGRHPNNVDVNYYRLHNPDLNSMTDDELITHFINFGKKENRICCRKDVCVIYIYYEIKNNQQHQSNLSFFLKYGLDKSRWRNMDITTLFVINGNSCEVLLPDSPDIHLLHTENNEHVDDDIELYKRGVDYFENKYKTTIDVLFKHLCLVHVNKFGPVYEDGKDKH